MRFEVVRGVSVKFINEILNKSLLLLFGLFSLINGNGNSNGMF